MLESSSRNLAASGASTDAEYLHLIWSICAVAQLTIFQTSLNDAEATKLIEDNCAARLNLTSHRWTNETNKKKTKQKKTLCNISLASSSRPISMIKQIDFSMRLRNVAYERKINIYVPSREMISMDVKRKLNFPVEASRLTANPWLGLSSCVAQQ